MRALVIQNYGPVDSHKVAEAASPKAERNQVLIRTRAIGLNYPDALMLEGRYQKKPATPFIPGRDLAGDIVGVGEGVEGYAPGDRVVAQVFSGGFAEMVAAPVQRVFKIPGKLSYVDAAGAITVFNTAYVAAVFRAEVKVGEHVMITGAAGGVGLAAVQLCTILGANVTAVVSSQEKADLCLANGATNVVILTTKDGEGLKNEFKSAADRLTGGNGYNVVIDTVGGDTFTAGLRALGFAGRMIVVGFASGQISETRLHYVLYNNLAILGAPLDIHFDKELPRMRSAVAHWTGLMARGLISANVTETSSFESIGDAFRRMLNRQIKGKIVLNVA